LLQKLKDAREYDVLAFKQLFWLKCPTEKKHTENTNFLKEIKFCSSNQNVWAEFEPKFQL